MLIGAETDFDFPELVISSNNIQSTQIICSMDRDGTKAVPLGGDLEPGLVNRDIAIVRERQKTTIPATAETGRLAVALELFL